MSRANANAFPIPGLQIDPEFNGLSVREHFAAMAMQGFCGCFAFRNRSSERIAALSVEQADALIKALAGSAP